MRKILKGKKLAATLLALAMLLCSFPAVFAENVEMSAEEAVLRTEEPVTEAEIEEIPEEAPAAEPEIAEIQMEEPETEAEIEEIPAEEPAAEPEIEEIPAEEPETEPEIEEIPEEESVAEPEIEEIPAEEPVAEPEIEEIPEEAPAAEPEIAEIQVEEPAAEPEIEEAPAEELAAEPEIEEIPAEEPAEAEENWQEDAQETEPAGKAEADDGDLIEIEDDDAGSVSEELLEEFNNPETYETAEFCGNVEIEMKNSEIHYGGEVTLAARVSGTEMNHRIVWEANDGDGRGWFAIGSGAEYTFTLTHENVNREYRVSLYAAG